MGHISQTPLKVRHSAMAIETRPLRRHGEVGRRRPTQGWGRKFCRFLGLLGSVILIASTAVAADSFFTRFSELRIVDGRELVSNGREGNWHPGRPVAGTWLAVSDLRLVLETRIYWRSDADVVVLKRLETSNP